MSVNTIFRGIISIIAQTNGLYALQLLPYGLVGGTASGRSPVTRETLVHILRKLGVQERLIPESSLGENFDFHIEATHGELLELGFQP